MDHPPRLMRRQYPASTDLTVMDFTHHWAGHGNFYHFVEDLLQLLRSGVDAVDGSSTGARAPWMWVLLRPPRFGGAKSCKRSRQLVSISRSQSFRFTALMRKAMWSFAVS